MVVESKVERTLQRPRRSVPSSVALDSYLDQSRPRSHALLKKSFPSDSFPPFGLLGLGARGPDWRFLGLGP
jgi:hypothetical protein